MNLLSQNVSAFYVQGASSCATTGSNMYGQGSSSGAFSYNPQGHNHISATTGELLYNSHMVHLLILLLVLVILRHSIPIHHCLILQVIMLHLLVMVLSVNKILEISKVSSPSLLIIDIDLIIEVSTRTITTTTKMAMTLEEEDTTMVIITIQVDQDNLIMETVIGQSTLKQENYCN